MATLVEIAGASVIGVGLIIELAGLGMLLIALPKIRKPSPEITTKGTIGDLADLVKQFNALIDKVGVGLGVPLIVMLLGMGLVSIGGSIIGLGKV
jgi:hypothetical protein